jgi:hypothetical protein
LYFTYDENGVVAVGRHEAVDVHVSFTKTGTCVIPTDDLLTSCKEERKREGGMVR